MPDYTETQDTPAQLLYETLTANTDAVLRLAAHAFNPDNYVELERLLNQLKEKYSPK